MIDEKRCKIAKARVFVEKYSSTENKENGEVFREKLSAKLKNF
jgi:hypothetical protein